MALPVSEPRVFVIDVNGKPLMPTTDKEANKLLTKGKARWESVYPPCLRLNYAVESSDSENPDIVLGLKPGGKDSSLALAIRYPNNRASEVIFTGIIQHRRGLSLEQRRVYRRSRRSQLWYRESRFDNRTKKKCKACGGNTPHDWELCRKCIEQGAKTHPLAPHLHFKKVKQTQFMVPPSILHHNQEILRTVLQLRKWCPISRINILHLAFDIQKLIDPEIRDEEYQYGPREGATDDRDLILRLYGYCCQICGKRKQGLMVVSYLGPSSKNYLINKICICRDCQRARADGEIRPRDLTIKPVTMTFAKIAQFYGLGRAWDIYSIEDLGTRVQEIRRRVAWAGLAQAGKNWLIYNLEQERFKVGLVQGWQMSQKQRELDLPTVVGEDEEKTYFPERGAIALAVGQESSMRISPKVWQISLPPKRKKQLYDANPVKLLEQQGDKAIFGQNVLVKNLAISKIQRIWSAHKKEILLKLSQEKDNVSKRLFTKEALQKISFKRVIVRRPDLSSTNVNAVNRNPNKGVDYLSQKTVNEAVVVYTLNGKVKFVAKPDTRYNREFALPEGAEILKVFQRGDLLKLTDGKIGRVASIFSNGYLQFEISGTGKKIVRSPAKAKMLQFSSPVVFM